uniref:Uncharacterized protein n=1 Tax=Schizaphis graminum TaxID=13262 RepID=A0A2S2PF65_SCHGA
MNDSHFTCYVRLGPRMYRRCSFIRWSYVGGLIRKGTHLYNMVQYYYDWALLRNTLINWTAPFCELTRILSPRSSRTMMNISAELHSIIILVSLYRIMTTVNNHVQPAAVADRSLVLANSTGSGGESSAVFGNGLNHGRRISLDESQRYEQANTVVLSFVGRTGQVSANRIHHTRHNHYHCYPVGVWIL